MPIYYNTKSYLLLPPPPPHLAASSFAVASTSPAPAPPAAAAPLLLLSCAAIRSSLLLLLLLPNFYFLISISYFLLVCCCVCFFHLYLFAALQSNKQREGEEKRQRKKILQSTVRDRQKPRFLVLRTTELTILAHDFGPCLPLSFFKKPPAFIFIFCYLAVCYLATRHLPCSAAFPLLFERCVASRRALCLLLTPFRAHVTKRSSRWPWRPQQASYGSQH